MTAPLQFLQEFRQQLLGISTYRADALSELIDALLLTLDPRSPIELGLTPHFAAALPQSTMRSVKD